MRWEVTVDDAGDNRLTVNINELVVAQHLARRSDGFWLFKLGDPSTCWIPSQAELDRFRELVSSMYTGPCIFYHYGVTAEFIQQPGFLTRLWRKIV